MPAIITVASLRTVLGVSVALYSDAYLEGIIDSAEQVILPLLTANQSAIAEVYLDDNVAYYVTQRPHYFVAGQTVVVSGVVPSAAFNGTITITDTIIDPYIFSAAKVNADILIRGVIPAGVAYLSGADAATLYASTDAIEQAVTIVSVEIFQSVVAPGGQIEGVDFTPSPYRMGRSLMNRVIGLLSPYIDVETMAM
ncbi:hypothetical protein UFOVP881_12 [uncultured Caudovirales phage]|uniref:Uncharacterized protein n=3 Tax=uncultured Caudovirales phage TaxID=2100421 RepID=A0A6J5PL24_9CAUD|nr:hypothetical protein UFOVP881_12 [uncultured Caudovirales phage]